MTGAWVQNAYVGNMEYVILFKNGTHHVINVDDNYEEFQGCYKDCCKYIEELQIGYAESLY